MEEDGEAEVGPDGQTEVLGNTTVKSTAESGTVHQAESSMDSSATDDAASNEVRAA